jgi:hypothetical protein
VFVVRNGVLQHPPHDLKAIQSMFAETNGEFSLLETDWSTGEDDYSAKVGCYVPEGMSTAIAGDVTAEDSEQP